jgi:non-heme chloroperoxidase
VELSRSSTTTGSEGTVMPYLAVGQDGAGAVDLYFEDRGAGAPVVLVHAYPLDSGSWAKQADALLAAGHRVISYDRRGFARSGRPATGYDIGTLTADLGALIEHLDLVDCVLAGASLGTGEVVHYLGRFGSARVRKAVLIGAVPPFLLRTADNPDGVDGSVFAAMRSALVADPTAVFTGLLRDLDNADVLGRTSDTELAARLAVALAAGPPTALGCLDALLADFRADLPRIDVPVLLLHGEDDRLAPVDASANRLPELIADLRLEVIPDGPHDLGWTFPELVNRYLLDFVAG